MEESMNGSSFWQSWGTNIRENLIASLVIGLSLVGAVVVTVGGSPSQLVNSIVTGGMWALLAVGLAIVFGVMNIPHFAHGESFMIGAYVAYFVFNPLHSYLQDHPNGFLEAVAPFAAIFAAPLVGFVLGAMMERLIFHPLRKRTREQWVMNTFLLTVGLGFILINGTNLVLGPNFRGIPRYWDVEPAQFLGVRISVDRLVALAIALITIAAFWFFLRRTRTGRAIRAVSQDETGALLVGIDLDFIHTLTFALATAMAALAGGSLLFLFQAYPTVGLVPLYFSWFVVILVGLGNVAGAVVGGFIVALVQTMTQQFFGISWGDVVPVIILVVILLLAPSGIFGTEIKGVLEQ
ncbi:MAG: High-affinity branched-chain amino acid transport system permease protein LivH [Anaerolineales bacterium]|nr:High-affinity branched-chain amino acid transport system permease protein LivH [Anaerolineales bacterium]